VSTSKSQVPSIVAVIVSSPGFAATDLTNSVDRDGNNKSNNSQQNKKVFSLIALSRLSFSLSRT
jgi:hypothetical protein